ncbi:MAG: hypothetical protein ISR29_06050 [SAR86 cluster bacterium]|jgi:type II secretory pathway component PulC|uniref:Uncharacterized protein n=1 Tax=SAR86 cluster bacterium TaxID=2030880 RepID=A0A937M318_9GAMM|nr:hypothetical protein [SAR86 cluster bacterium]MDC0873031.1 hypothetical protein [Gammaproteobacteria bacterium]|tara:strand:+ start:3316 stop:3708 length:393 start_codon:yes stop_codon:yes gene_type:complete
MNTRKIKRIINTLVALLLLLLVSMLLISFINKPEIKDIRFTNLNEISKSNIETQTNEVTSINEADFNYTIVGYRFGESNSSVILKKGSKEFVLYEGDILENTYELSSISQDEIIFKASGKLYKLENKVGK